MDFGTYQSKLENHSRSKCYVIEIQSELLVLIGRYFIISFKGLNFSTAGTTPWPNDFGADDFHNAMEKAFNDSYVRTSGFTEITTALGSVFYETDIKMKRVQSSLEGTFHVFLSLL